MNEKTKFILITFLLPVILILWGVLGAGLIPIVVALTWMGLSILVFQPLGED
jgi:uncharacterized ion transporter superfamily protein YfcC